MIVKIRYDIEMYIICWEQVSYEILNHESKLLRIKVPLFHVFHGLHEFIFLEIYIYVNRETLLIFDWKKHTSDSIWFYYLVYHYSIFLFRFSKGITNMPRVTAPPAAANKLQLSLSVGNYNSALAHYSICFFSVRTINQLPRQLVHKGLV